MSELNSRPTPDALDEATGALREAPVPPGPPPELAAATVALISNRLAGAVPAEQVRRERRRRIMRYAGFTTATAGAVALAVVLWSPGRSGAAMFERAMENAEKANSLRAKITTTAGEMTFEMKMYGQGERFRNEMDMGKLGGFAIIIDGKEKKGLHLNTGAKTAQWLDLSKPDKKQEAAMKDAAGVAGLFAGLKGKKVQELPEETIDGRKLKVFAVKGHKLAGSQGEADITVWIDPKTELPAKTRTEMTVNGVKAVAVMEALGWNEELDAKLFELKVPEGYKVVEQPEKK